jgi:hypothetical protein
VNSPYLWTHEREAGVVAFAVRLTVSGEHDVEVFLAARRLVAEELLDELGFAVPR